MAMESTECTIPIKDLLGLLEERSLDLNIFKVPYKLRTVNEAAYSPLILSIGPYHANTGTRSFLRQKLAKKQDHRRAAKEDDNRQRNKTSLLEQKLAKKCDHLLDMEEHKLWYMLFFLERTKDGKKTLDEFRTKIEGAVESVHLSYAEYIDFGSNELVEMMMVDGCFILELFIRSWFKDSPYEAAFKSWCDIHVHKDDPKSQREDNPYDADPIFQNSWMLPTLRQDLALLENQIPFFILRELYEIFMLNRKLPPQIPPNTSHQKFEIPFDNSHQKFDIPSIPLLALSFFRPDLKLNQLKSQEWKDGEKIKKKCGPHVLKPFWHLLDLLHNFYSPTSCEKDSTSARSEETLGFKEGATKLCEAGIESVNKSEKNFIEVEFDKEKGDIKIPQLKMDKTTKSLLMNLIAYEQCSPKRKYHISSYVILMKSLLRSSTDAELLQNNKIITDNLGVNENVSNFLKKISIELVPENFCFHPLCKDVNKYRQNWWHYHRITAFCKVRRVRYCKALKENHFSDPWRIMALITAIILLCLTALQTWYTVYS